MAKLGASLEGGRGLRNDDILILKGFEVNSLLVGQESRIIDTVRMAYYDIEVSLEFISSACESLSAGVQE